MSMTKFSPDDISRLTERLNRFESELKALKVEKKAHFSAIKEGTIRIVDDSSIERVKMGKISEGNFGIKINDSGGDNVIEVTDEAIVIGETAITIKVVGHNKDATDGDILFEELIVPEGKKVLIIAMPIVSLSVIFDWTKFCYDNSIFVVGLPIAGNTLAVSFQGITSWANKVPGSGQPSYPELVTNWETGTYENIKLYARYVYWYPSDNSHFEIAHTASWIALEIDAEET